MTFLFGELPAGADPDDAGRRAELLARTHPDLPLVGLAALEAIATQIAEDDPPEVWQTARRLLEEGYDAGAVKRQLSMTFGPYLVDALGGESSFDVQRYVGALGRLPLPTAADSERALLEAGRHRRIATMEELIGDAAKLLGARADDSGVESQLERLLEELMHPDQPLDMLAGDHVVHVEALTDGLVLTHRLTEVETALGVLEVDVDLAGFRRRNDLPQVSAPEGSLLAVSVTAGVVSVEILGEEPAVEPELVALLRERYDDAVAEPWLPVPVEELVLGAVAAEPSRFRAPAAPLTLLLAAAGLEVRGSEVAHEASVWQMAEQVDEWHRLRHRFGPGEPLDTILRVLADVEGELDTTTAREVLDDLDDPDVLETVTDLLLGRQEDPDPPATLGRIAGRLLAAASRPAPKAVARWLLCVVAEREDRLEVAEEHLREAVRLDPQWPPAVDRLAWYRSDRGDAAGALALWRTLGPGAAEDDVRELEALPVPPAVTVGRNERCWCGSGRKYKQCHLAHPEPLALPERVGWLCRKAVGFVERRGAEAGDEVVEHVLTRSVNPEDGDSVRDAVSDPLVLDVLLHESRWFERFLDERGVLLPEDEELLGRAWTLVDRTVYEIVETRRREGVTVRDLRTGEVFEVRERSFSTVARPGQRICGRAVPDGSSHQFIGGLFEVAPGTERGLLDLLDDGDGLELLAYVADLHRPPVVVGPDGKVLDLAQLPAGPSPAPLEVDPEVVREVVESLEQRWCSEPVPALGGVTPQEAAADPTRRDDLARLIDSFPVRDPATGAFGLRPEVLRERLGLGPGPDARR